MIYTAFKGPDISEHNGKLDFTKIKGNYDFVILRCGYGSDYSFQDDGEFQRNAEACENLGIPYGVYLYSYAGTKASAVSEANHVLRLIKDKKPSCGIWYDIEDASLPKDNELLTDICISFLEHIEKSGGYAGIYSSLSWFASRLSSPKLDPYDKWVAQWNSSCDYQKPYGIWQFSSDETIPGLSGRFDMNYFYKDYPKIIGGMADKPDKSYAKKYSVTAKSGLNLREGPSTAYPIITALPYGSIVSIKSTADGWGLREGGGYLSMNYLSEVKAAKSMAVTPDVGLNIRKGPGTGYDILKAVPKGTVLKVLSIEDGWALLEDGSFASAKYLK